jgi:uncharacterized protein (TIGR02217 family)
MAIYDFLEMQLVTRISGSKGGLSYISIVVTNPSVLDTTFPQTSRGYWKTELDLSQRSKNEMKAITAFWAAAKGKSVGWRYRNLREYYTSSDAGVGGIQAPESIPGYTSGTSMQLTHIRTQFGDPETVLITKPDINSMGGTTGDGSVPFYLYRDGSPTPWPSASNWTLDVTKGIVTFASDQTGHTFEWYGSWDQPTRFDVDDQDAAWVDFDVMEWKSIKLQEIQLTFG